MNNDEIVLVGLLEKLNIKHTRTLTVKLTANNEYGQKIGEGDCKAVVLRLNNYVRNTASTVATPNYFYWGDNQRQEYEVLRGVNSQIIFCTDLSEIQARCHADAEIQVMVYT